jgi:hypothetical protein
LWWWLLFVSFWYTDALCHYGQHGETHKGLTEDKKIAYAIKKKDAEEVSKLVEMKSSRVQKELESREKKRRAKEAEMQSSAKRAKLATGEGGDAPTESGPVEQSRELEIEQSKALVGRRLAKHFHVGKKKILFFGRVTDFSERETNEEVDDFWDVTYDDGDGESMSKSEIEDAFELYEKNKAKDPTASG